MTTIAFKNGIMAADTQETVGDVPRYCQKLLCGKDSTTVIGTTGDGYATEMFADWWNAGGDPSNCPTFSGVSYDDAEFECLIWDEGKLYTANNLLKLAEVSLEDFPYYALGSGSDIALGAMAMGAGAKRAVEIACDHNIYTGLPVETRKCK